MLLPLGFPIWLALPHSGLQHPTLFILSREIKVGRGIGRGTGAWMGEASRVRGRGKHMPLTPALPFYLLPHNLFGFTKTVQDPLAYFTGEETKALRDPMTCLNNTLCSQEQDVGPPLL